MQVIAFFIYFVEPTSYGLTKKWNGNLHKNASYQWNIIEIENTTDVKVLFGLCLVYLFRLLIVTEVISWGYCSNDGHNQ